MTLIPQLENLVSKIGIDEVPQKRRDILQPLIDYIRSKASSGLAIRLNFICTHNSRRSHLSQVWAQAIAYHCGVGNVFAYSGGTESTALFPMVAETLKSMGFQLETIAATENPIYAIKTQRMNLPLSGFPKNGICL